MAYNPNFQPPNRGGTPRAAPGFNPFFQPPVRSNPRPAPSSRPPMRGGALPGNSGGATLDVGMRPPSPSVMRPPAPQSNPMSASMAAPRSASSNPGSGGALSFAAGGPVDALDTGEQPDAITNSMNDALQLVSQVMRYGRQKHGIEDAQQGGIQEASLTPMIPGNQSEHWPGGKPGDGPVRPQAGYIPRVPASQSEYGPEGRPPQGPPVQRVLPPLQVSEEEGEGETTQQAALPVDEEVQSLAEGGPVEDDTEDTDVTGSTPAPDDGSQDAAEAGQPSQAAPGRQETGEGFRQPGDVGAMEKAGLMPHNLLQQIPGVKQIASWIQGAGGMEPAQTKALEDAADPQGSRHESDRKLAAVAEANKRGGPDAALGAVQGYRKQYNMLNSFAAVKLNQGDTQAAAEAATQAQNNMLDGKRVSFAYNGDGVTVAVTNSGETNPSAVIQLTKPQFNAFLRGSEGQYDIVHTTGLEASLQKLAGTAGKALDQQQGTARPNAQFSGGVRSPSAGAQPVQPNYDPQIEARSREMFPSVGQNTERLQWIAAQEQQREKNKIDLAKSRHDYTVDAARIRADASRDVATTRGGTARDVEASKSTDRKATVANNLNIAIRKIEGTQGNVQLIETMKNARSYLNSPEYNEAEFKKRFPGFEGFLNAPQAPQAQAPRAQAPQAPQPGGKAKPKAVLGPDGKYHPVQ